MLGFLAFCSRSDPEISRTKVYAPYSTEPRHVCLLGHESRKGVKVIIPTKRNE